MADFKYEIVEEIGVLSENARGWTKELNKVSWNGGAPKYDLRDWAPDHEKMGKGITLTEEEAKETEGTAVAGGRLENMNDKYATALERALYNWYYGENGSDPEPVFNAMSQGAEMGMQCLIPIETPQELLQQLLEAESLQDGASFTINEELPISFQHLVVDEEGHYLIPIFTSSEQLNIGGEGSAAINQSFGELLDSLDQWPDCLGYVVNPFTNKIMVDRNIRDKVRNFQPKSHVAFVQGSVLDLHVDAVVNSAHKTLLGGVEVDEVLLAEAEGIMDEAMLCGGGLNGAIHAAAGQALFDECKTLGGCMPGDAKITKAYGIEYDDYIIHTVGPFSQNDEEEEEVLASCCTKALDLTGGAWMHQHCVPEHFGGSQRVPDGQGGAGGSDFCSGVV